MRRGPSSWTQLIRWDTENDRFDEGQWVHARVFPRRSDLSPDGSLLIYFASSYKSDPPTWTAISRVPYWTAIQFWPKSDSWGGGGLFFSDKQFTRYEIHSEDYPIFEKRLTRDGWRLQEDWKDLEPNHLHSVLRLAKPNRTGNCDLLMDAHTGVGEKPQGVGVYYETYRLKLRGAAQTMEMSGVEWAEWDFRGRLIFTRGGAAYTALVLDGILVERELYVATNEQPDCAPPPGDAQKPAQLHEISHFAW
ncbi:MAG: hypothetical protein H7144_06715 [Burkholderiales bacterium]|nr:hypothetical protein [Phycisphaerae bacterium]